jgi:transcriptional regulator with XRE-family HTH domain
VDGRGSALRRLRRARDLSVARVAALVGVSIHTVYNWERGTSRVPAQRVESLACALQLGVDDLLAALAGGGEAGDAAAGNPAARNPAAGNSAAGNPAARNGAAGSLVVQPVGLPSPSVSSPSPLAALRLRARLSQVAAAQRLGISRSSIRVYETGGPVPLAQLRRMATLYRVPMVRLAAAGGVTCPRELDRKSWRPGDLGPVLRVLREWSGLTQGELALRIGASRDAVRAWENGRYQPGPPLRHNLEQLYRLPEGALRRAYTGPEVPVDTCAGTTAGTAAGTSAEDSGDRSTEQAASAL